MIWDEATGKYVLVDIESAQVDMFHTYGRASDSGSPYYAEGEVVEARDGLPSPSTLLPETTGDLNDEAPAF